MPSTAAAGLLAAAIVLPRIERAPAGVDSESIVIEFVSDGDRAVLTLPD